MSPECLSALAVDRLLGDELSGDELGRAQAHLRNCADCSARFEAARGFKARLAEELGPLGTGRAVARPSAKGRVRAAAAGVLALAAALVIFLQRATPDAARDEASGTRTKGGGRLGFFVKRGTVVERGAPGQVLRPGDAVEFTYSAARDGYLAVLSIDGAKRASVYYPNAARAQPIALGERLLEQSTVLDSALGRERWFALFCESAIELEPIRARLEAEPERPLVVAGCSLDSVSVSKEPP